MDQTGRVKFGCSRSSIGRARVYGTRGCRFEPYREYLEIEMDQWQVRFWQNPSDPSDAIWADVDTKSAAWHFGCGYTVRLVDRKPVA
jgi:hypothetical protein